MVNSCSVPGCKYVYHPYKKVCMHGFPHGNEALMQKWIKAINRKNWYPAKHTRICGSHFVANDYISVCSRRLKPNVVPSRLLPLSNECQNEEIQITQTPVERTAPLQQLQIVCNCDNPIEGTSNREIVMKINKGTQTSPLKISTAHQIEMKKKIKALQKKIQRQRKRITNLLEELKKIEYPK